MKWEERGEPVPVPHSSSEGQCLWARPWLLC